MNLKFIIYFTFLLIKLIDSSLLITKSWESTCVILSCDRTIDVCIQNGCLGLNNCKSCLNTNNQNCGVCFSDIITETDHLQSNGEPTIICDITKNFHKLACQFFCRINFSIYSECSVVNGFPVCNCLDNNLISTTTLATPQNPSKILFFVKK